MCTYVAMCEFNRRLYCIVGNFWGIQFLRLSRIANRLTNRENKTHEISTIVRCIVGMIMYHKEGEKDYNNIIWWYKCIIITIIVYWLIGWSGIGGGGRRGEMIMGRNINRRGPTGLAIARMWDIITLYSHECVYMCGVAYLQLYSVNLSLFRLVGHFWWTVFYSSFMCACMCVVHIVSSGRDLLKERSQIVVCVVGWVGVGWGGGRQNLWESTVHTQTCSILLVYNPTSVYPVLNIRTIMYSVLDPWMPRVCALQLTTLTKLTHEQRCYVKLPWMVVIKSSVIWIRGSWKA